MVSMCRNDPKKIVEFIAVFGFSVNVGISISLVILRNAD